MALDGTYAGLQASVADWLARDDLTSQIQDFIKLGEEELNKSLRLRCMQADYSLIASSTPTALPADFLEFRSVRHTAVPFSAVSLVPEQWANDHDYYWAYYPNLPAYYTIEGLDFRLVTLQSGTWTLDTTYYQKLNIASDTDPATTVFTKYPSLYLFSALRASLQFIGNDERGQGWVDQFNQQKSYAIDEDNSAKWSGSTRVMRVRRAP